MVVSAVPTMGQCSPSPMKFAFAAAAFALKPDLVCRANGRMQLTCPRILEPFIPGRRLRLSRSGFLYRPER